MIVLLQSVSLSGAVPAKGGLQVVPARRLGFPAATMLALVGRTASATYR